MKTVFHSAVGIAVTLWLGIAAPLSAAPYSVISVPSAGQCDESVIPASAFADKGEVFVRLDNVSPGVLSVGVCDAGKNGVTCSLVQSEGGTPSRQISHAIFPGICAFTSCNIR